jgi:hypothetical protein
LIKGGQVLERILEVITSIKADIRAHNRHENMEVIYSNDHLQEREFAHWRIGLNILNNSSPSDYQALDTGVKKLLNE